MCKGGCSGLLVFLDINNDSVLRVLNVTSHCFDQESILRRSSFSLTTASFGLLTGQCLHTIPARNVCVSHYVYLE